MPEPVTEAQAVAMLKSRPSTATHAIIAQLEQDESDSQSDYFGSRTVKRVLLAWSTHGRDLFSEMRKAAARFEPTACYGPGKDKWTARVVHANTIPGFYKGHFSHWHREFEDANGRARSFETEAEARAFVGSCGPLTPVNCDGATATFEWSVTCESVEQREKYSMGHGYYLGHSRYHGWQVRKVVLGDYNAKELTAAIMAGDYVPDLFSAQAKAQGAPASDTVTVATVRENESKNGVEVVFPDKPSELVRAQLKAAGFRWSGAQGLWYAKRSPATLEAAHRIAGDPEQGAKAAGDLAETQAIRGMLEAQGIE